MRRLVLRQQVQVEQAKVLILVEKQARREQFKMDLPFKCDFFRSERLIQYEIYFKNVHLNGKIYRQIFLQSAHTGLLVAMHGRRSSSSM